MNCCKNCGVSTLNPSFCSKNCSSTFNNKLRQKLSDKHCACGIKIDRRSTKCRKCACGKITIAVTIGEWKKKRKYQTHSRVRDHARNIYKRSGQPQQCIICGYNRKYDVCHIKGISTFSDDTPILVINDITNLIALCKLHHDEFDDGVLTIPH